MQKRFNEALFKMKRMLMMRQTEKRKYYKSALRLIKWIEINDLDYNLFI